MRSRSIVPATLTRLDARSASEKHLEAVKHLEAIKQAQQQHVGRRSQSQVAPKPMYLPAEELICPTCKRPYHMNERLPYELSCKSSHTLCDCCIDELERDIQFVRARTAVQRTSAVVESGDFDRRVSIRLFASAGRVVVACPVCAELVTEETGFTLSAPHLAALEEAERERKRRSEEEAIRKQQADIAAAIENAAASVRHKNSSRLRIENATARSLGTTSRRLWPERKGVMSSRRIVYNFRS